MVDGDEYDVSLRTLTGVCKRRDGACALRADDKRYKVTIPGAHTCGG